MGETVTAVTQTGTESGMCMDTRVLRDRETKCGRNAVSRVRAFDV
jgi:hypothetical protein